MRRRTRRRKRRRCFADFLLGDLYQSEAAVSIARPAWRDIVVHHGWAFYIDDTWKVTSKLTLTLGLRYEVTPPFYDTAATRFRSSIPYEDRTPNVADKSRYPKFERTGPCSGDVYQGISIRWPQIETVCDGKLGDASRANRLQRFRPAHRHHILAQSKWVIRSGHGMFYNQDTGNPRFDLARNLAGRIRVNSELQNPTIFWSNALSNISGGVANITVPYSFANKYERRTPYSMEYLLNIQRQLSNSLVFEIGYLGSISRKLEFLRAVNESVPGTVGSAQIARAVSTFGRIQLVDNSANGDYNALSLKLTKRFSMGFTFLSSFYLGEVHGRFERHSCTGLRHAVPAEQLLPQMRVGPFGVRYTAPVCDLGTLRSSDWQGAPAAGE